MNSLKIQTLAKPELLDSPAVLVFPAVVAQNIAKAIELAGGADRLCPHVKTDKITEVTAMLMQQGVTMFKCATIAEAEMLGRLGAPRVLLAYQPAGPKIARFLQLITTFPGTQFACLVDNAATATQLSAATDAVLSVFIDVNVGMDRTGIRPEGVLDLVQVICGCGLSLSGLHVYDGHIEDTDLALRRERAAAVWATVRSLSTTASGMLGQGVELIMAGSPTFAYYAAQSLLDRVPHVRVSPGTFTFWDAGYAQLLPELPFGFGVILLTRVVSILDESRICLDLGYKAVASESPYAQRVLFPDIPQAEVVMHSEEHLVISVGDTTRFQVGDVVYGVPWHVCPTIALYEQVFVVEQRQLTANWQVVARNRKITI